MPRATTNISLRKKRPIKALRRQPIETGLTPESNRAEGASGNPRKTTKRPGRAASLRSASNRTRSQRWRNPEKGGKRRRRGNLAKGSRTGRNRTSRV